ncbi:T9SS type A sorting domain-containing protein, partial [bacterium]|nr:T9SS type A sorting domain-containing protein [bacterium]
DPLTIGWFHDEGYGDFFFQGNIDEVRISNTVRYGGEPPPPPVEISMTPHNPPIIIPPGGGALAYNIAGGNNTPDPMEFDLWTSIIMPNGSAFTLLGPLTLELEANEHLERDRSIFVPEMAPPGAYFCSAGVGFYPWEIWAMDGFEFVKEGPGGGSNYNLNGWIESGEAFPGEGDHVALIPTEFSLHGAFPNPFNPTATIRYNLPEAQKVTLSIYDVSGRLVTKLIDGWRNAGQHEAVFDAEGLSSGMYLYHIQAGEYTSVEKMVLLK